MDHVEFKRRVAEQVVTCLEVYKSGERIASSDAFRTLARSFTHDIITDNPENSSGSYTMVESSVIKKIVDDYFTRKGALFVFGEEEKEMSPYDDMKHDTTTHTVKSERMIETAPVKSQSAANLSVRPPAVIPQQPQQYQREQHHYTSAHTEYPPTKKFRRESDPFSARNRPDAHSSHDKYSYGHGRSRDDRSMQQSSGRGALYERDGRTDHRGGRGALYERDGRTDHRGGRDRDPRIPNGHRGQDGDRSGQHVRDWRERDQHYATRRDQSGDRGQSYDENRSRSAPIRHDGVHRDAPVNRGELRDGVHHDGVHHDGVHHDGVHRGDVHRGDVHRGELAPVHRADGDGVHRADGDGVHRADGAGPAPGKSGIDRGKKKFVPKIDCEFWLRGACKRGDQCTFSHAKPDPRKKELCKYMMGSGHCSLGDRCNYNHDTKAIPCKFYLLKDCYHGSSCRFSHTPMDSAERYKWLGALFDAQRYAREAVAEEKGQIEVAPKLEVEEEKPEPEQPLEENPFNVGGPVMFE